MNYFNKIPYKAVIVLFSKIIIKCLRRDQINIFRKVEKITKLQVWNARGRRVVTKCPSTVIHPLPPSVTSRIAKITI